MKLAIVGSTRLAGNEEALNIIRKVLREKQPSLVVSGGAKGIDSMAVAEAEALGIDTREFLPTLYQWAPHGFKERNLLIAMECDELVRIVSTKSTTYGSGWTRDRAKEMGKPTEEYIVGV